LRVPSDAILREIESLVTKGSYDQHPWLGATGTDMTYEIASKMGVSKTYGWLIVQVISESPAASAGLQGGTQQVQIGGTIYTIGGDVIIAINGNTIINGDALFTYIEENTQPGQTINLTVIRNQAETNIDLTLGTRPAPSV
jgi:S1-C subfamily serine protease